MAKKKAESRETQPPAAPVKRGPGCPPGSGKSGPPKPTCTAAWIEGLMGKPKKTKAPKVAEEPEDDEDAEDGLD